MSEMRLVRRGSAPPAQQGGSTSTQIAGGLTRHSQNLAVALLLDLGFVEKDLKQLSFKCNVLHDMEHH